MTQATGTVPLGNMRLPTYLFKRLEAYVNRTDNAYANRSEVVRTAIFEFLERHDTRFDLHEDAEKLPR